MAEGELEQRIATLEGELRAVQEKSVLENKAHTSEVKGLKEQIAVLKDSTKVRYAVSMLALHRRVSLLVVSFSIDLKALLDMSFLTSF